jgi:O-glycosyl hydrolase
MRRFFALAFLLLGGCAAPAPPVPTPTVLTVSQTPQQTIKGWGIYPCTIQNDRPDASLYTLWHRPNASRLIWQELGISLWRCEILPGSYDAKRDDGSLDEAYLRGSLERQLRLGASFGQKPVILSIWSPPGVFKSPPTTLGIDPKTKRMSSLRVQREADFCRFVARVLLHIKAQGLALPIALSVQNEPNFASPLWNGTAYSPAQWKRVMVQMRRTLDQNGLQSVALLGPEGGSYAQSLAFVGGAKAPVLNDAALRRTLGGFAFHGYTVESKRDPNPQQLRSVALAMQRAGKAVWMTEWSLPGDKPDPLDHALETAQRLGRETAYIPCNYWTWWQGWYPRHPKGEVLLTGSDDAHLHVSKTFFVLQKLWHSARVGSVVHRVESNDADISGFDAHRVQAVAFQSDKHQTLLLVNPTTSAKALQVRGLTGASATPFLTDRTRDMKARPKSGVSSGKASWTLPPRSIEVVVVR